jgi:hypothetical protein
VSEPDALYATQRGFARFVTAVDAEGEIATPRVRSDRGVPALARLRVYSEAYFERILSALREDFGALNAALGDDAFHDLAKLYLMAHPSRSFSLRFAGERLPEFLSGPVAEVFARHWPFAADLASLEWALTDVFDAPDATVLERESLAGISADEWPALRFALVPAERRLRLAWPVHEIRDAWSADLPLPTLRASATTVLVWRQEECVRSRALSALEADALDRVEAGADFASICASVVEATSESEGPSRVLAMLERWIADGLLL